MEEFSWLNHPAVKNIDPAKLALLVSFSESAKGKSPQSILPLLMQSNTKMQSENLTFSQDEQDLLVEVLTEGMSQEDKQKVKMIKSFAEKNKKK